VNEHPEKPEDLHTVAYAGTLQ